MDNQHNVTISAARVSEVVTSRLINDDSRRNPGTQRLPSAAAISIHTEGKKLLEKHAIAPSAARLCSMRADMLFIITIAAATCRRVKGAEETGTLLASFFRFLPSKIEIQMTAAPGNFQAGRATAQARTQIVAQAGGRDSRPSWNRFHP